MSLLSSRLIRYVRFPLALSAIGLALVLGFQGVQAAWLTLVLLLLEISLSFDNAIVNARVLDRMTPGQQRFFLTWGLVIPVFGVRFLGPLVMVALAGQVGLGEALDAALHHPDHYRELLEIAEPRILAFGGMFLLMVFLHYFFDEAKTLHWWTPLEKRLSAAGRIEALEVAVALIVLLVLVVIAPGEMRGDLMVCGVLGVVLQLLATSLADAFGDEAEAGARVAAGGGLRLVVVAARGQGGAAGGRARTEVVHDLGAAGGAALVPPRLQLQRLPEDHRAEHCALLFGRVQACLGAFRRACAG